MFLMIFPFTSLFFLAFLNLIPGTPDSVVATENHAIYIGVVEIEHLPEKNTTGVLIKVFSDDLMNALINAGSKKLTTEEEMCTGFQAAIETYFNEHFVLTVNDTVAGLKILDCTPITDSHWLEFSAEAPASWEQLKIKADFFMELFPTQSNMITLILNEKRSFYRTTKGRAEFDVILEK